MVKGLPWSRPATLRRVAPLAALVALAAGGWIARGSASTPTASARPAIVAQLPRELSVARMRADLRSFQRIADRHGNTRAASTEGYAASVRYVRTELRRAGYNARVVGFPFVEYRESVEEGRQIAPISRDLPIEALEFSPSTPKGGVRGQVVPGDDGCEAGDFNCVRGSIALVRRGTCFFAVKAQNAGTAGAWALLIFNTERGPFDGTLGDPQASAIPVAAVAGVLGSELAASPDAVVELELSAQSRRSKSQNVIADAGPALAAC